MAIGPGGALSWESSPPCAQEGSCGIWVPKLELLSFILDGAVFLDALGLDFRFFPLPGAWV